MFTVGYTITSVLEYLFGEGEPETSNMLLATKLPAWIFAGEGEDKQLFEDLFTVYDNDVSIHYVSSLSRARITFSDEECAIACKRDLNGLAIDCNSKLNLSFTYLGSPEKKRLDVPKAERQFLISPPSSPPVGWEPVVEMEPHVDEMLLAAIEKLGGKDLADDDLMLIPEEEANPAVTLKMSEKPDFQSSPLSEEEGVENKENRG